MKNTVATLAFALLAVAAVAAPEQVLLAAEDDWYPHSAKVGAEAQGRSVDIVKAAYEAVGAALILEVVPFNRGLVYTKSDRYAGVFNAGLNDEVRRDYLIPRNTLTLSEQVVVARTGETFQGKSSFNGKRLTLTLGYTYPADITSDPRNTIERAVGDINNLNKIALDRADFTIIDRLVYLALLIKEPSLKHKLAVVGKLQTEKIYVLFSKTGNGKKALALFDEGMDKISRNGVLKKINESWETQLR